jgi:hypothetical protein
MMENFRLHSTATSIVSIVCLLLPGGFWLTRYVARRMGDARRARLAEVDRILGGLAVTMVGRFQPGPLLTRHRLLGELRLYGVTRLDRGPLAIEVGVSYPADDLRDDRTTVRVRRPADRRWRVRELRLRRPPEAVIAGTTEQDLPRSFYVSGAVELPPAVCEALLRVATHASSLELRDDWLELIAQPDGDSVSISDIARLRSLIEQVVETSERLLLPPQS